ncbi:MAG: hypothetical protein UIH27_13940, partial [Ruminococcus sp.]|nr:hypothetical protein [Ruminococcus sp.]
SRNLPDREQCCVAEGDFSTRFLARVLYVGYFGNVGVSRDRIGISEVMRAMETTFSYSSFSLTA